MRRPPVTQAEPADLDGNGRTREENRAYVEVARLARREKKHPGEVPAGEMEHARLRAAALIARRKADEAAAAAAAADAALASALMDDGINP